MKNGGSIIADKLWTDEVKSEFEKAEKDPTFCAVEGSSKKKENPILQHEAEENDEEFRAEAKYAEFSRKEHPFETTKFTGRHLEAFFIKLEMDLELQAVTSQLERAGYLLRCLSVEQLDRILIKKDPKKDELRCYEKLKELVIETFTRPAHERIRDLFSGKGLINIRPTKLYERLLLLFNFPREKISGAPFFQEHFRETFLYYLPSDVATVVRPGALSSCTIQQLVEVAEIVYVTSSRAAPASVATQAGSSSHIEIEQVVQTAVGECFKDQLKSFMEDIIDALKSEPSDQPSFRDDNSQPKGNATNPDPAVSSTELSLNTPKNDLDQDTSGYCYYHARFGGKAHKCVRPSSCKHPDAHLFGL